MYLRNLIPIGILLIFLGMLAVFIGSISSVKIGDKNTKVAVGGFIGFIPFGFANDKNLLYFVLGLSAFLIIVFLLIGRYWR